jgi:hypothetical protein
MRKFNFILLPFSLLIPVSCNKIGVKSEPIPVEQIFGTYDLYNGEKITLKKDFTYEHFYIDNELIKNDTGIWGYQRFDVTKTNEIRTFDMRAISEDGKRNYHTEYMTHRFYACKYWGKIIITRGYAGDPDGAPPLNWYDKCDGKQQINQHDLVGCYEHLSKAPPWDGIRNIIRLEDDSTFVHYIYRYDSLLIKEKGKWEYYNNSNFNIITFDYFTIYIQYRSKEMIIAKTSFEVKKTLFGSIYFAVIVPYAPNGAPMQPKYKKIKAHDALKWNENE